MNEPRISVYASVNWVIIGPANSLLPILYQAITWTVADFFWIGPCGTKKIQLKIWSVKWQPFYSGFSVLTHPPSAA